jgi:formate dehydrogenase major subunit
VEVARQPALQPACTYPVAEGLEVQTETPRVAQMRKFVLEMLFSERNHYCMVCEMSGDCELQTLAYKYGLDHWTYRSPNQSFPVDGSRKYFIMDHNRCILCRRCVRACADLAASHTLGMRMRGSKTMISADMDVAFGDSTCVSCGSCLQVCPTGALVDRKSAYMGRNVQTERTASTCTGCAVGCQTQVVTRAGHPLRIEGDWAGLNGGVMCRKGRFEPVYDAKARVATPLLRKNGKLEATDIDDALETIAGKMRAAGGKGVKAWTTAAMSNEVLAAFAATFSMTGADQGIIEAAPAAAEVLELDGTLASLTRPMSSSWPAATRSMSPRFSATASRRRSTARRR